MNQEKQRPYRYLEMGISKMISNIILILVIMKLTRCSLVLDAMSQNTLYVSSYCPVMKNCIEGSHVICQYYDHRRTVGELCHNYVKVSITSRMVQQILDGVNKIRMKLTTGKETGKDDQPLPRAYGMMRMHWDSELATLAQVLADQCLGLKEDNCRATDKFENPSQIITLINFKAPNWEYLNNKTTETTVGLNSEKIRSSISKALKSLHGIKRLISSHDINQCPVLEKLPDKGSRSYLKLIRGKATHIGCGISAYTRAHILSSGSQHIYNSLQLVCNVSDGPLQSEPVYTTNPPLPDTGFTDKCGCPEGYKDSNGCLCEKDTHGLIENTEIQWRDFNLNKHGKIRNQSNEVEPHGNSNYDAANVVVLPIFEIHDAPDSSYESENDVVKQIDRRFGNTSFMQSSMEDNEIPDIDNGFRHPEFREAVSGDEKELKPNENVPLSLEESAEPFQHVIRASIEHNNAELDDTRTQNSGVDDRMEEQYSFLEILENLERAMKNIELEGAEKDIFDFKMRKNYEAALKPKSLRGSNELEDEFQKLTDYLRGKSDAALEDERVHSDNEDNIIYDLLNRGDNDSDEFINDIDEKLLEILIKKHHHNDDYFSKNRKINYQSDENYSYTNYPLSRKQEKINKFNKNSMKANKIERILAKRNSKSLRPKVTESQNEDVRKLIKKKINNDRQRKLAVYKRKMGVFNNLDKANKIRAYPNPGRKAKKTFKFPGYRRVYETEHERPTLRTTTQIPDKIKLQIISHKKRKYLKKDRAIL